MAKEIRTWMEVTGVKKSEVEIRRVCSKMKIAVRNRNKKDFTGSRAIEVLATTGEFRTLIDNLSR